MSWVKNEWKWTSDSEWIERIWTKTNEICEMSEQLVSMLRDEAEIILSEADGSISYTTHLTHTQNAP